MLRTGYLVEPTLGEVVADLTKSLGWVENVIANSVYVIPREEGVQVSDIGRQVAEKNLEDYCRNYMTERYRFATPADRKEVEDQVIPNLPRLLDIAPIYASNAERDTKNSLKTAGLSAATAVMGGFTLLYGTAAATTPDPNERAGFVSIGGLLFLITVGLARATWENATDYTGRKDQYRTIKNHFRSDVIQAWRAL